MLLTEHNINGQIKRLSNKWLPLEHMWDAGIASFSSVKIAPRKKYGGYVETVFGRMDILPDVFDENWPPPSSYSVTAKITHSNEVSAAIMFEGIAHRERIKRDGIEYQLYGQGFNVTVTDNTYQDDLASLFSALCASLEIGIDLSAARNPSPQVDYSFSGTKLLIDVMSDMAAFFSHCFYIQNDVLYLIDMLSDNGITTLTEFDIFPSVYNDPPPITRIKASFNGNEYSVPGPSDYGGKQAEVSITPVCHTVQADIEDALMDIKSILERPSVQLIKPLSEPPIIGQRINIIDESTWHPLNTWARARSVTWDFDREQCVIEGEGVIS